MRRSSTVVIALLLIVAGFSLPDAAASASAAPRARHQALAYADPSLPGPKLAVARPLLAAALTCSPGFAASKGQPVLLSPGTGATAAANFSWGVEPALTQEGYPWCAVNPPDNQMGDIQVAAEYTVYAIRRMYEQTHHKVAILGHSQGGLQPRWALRFWPDVRSEVDKWIGVDASNHGYDGSSVLGVALLNCKLACPPALTQQAKGSAFLTAVNESQETFPGIAYTSIYTTADEIVTPNSGPGHCSSCLTGPASRVSNIPIQQVCPGRYAEHIEVIADAVMWAIVRDALTHNGPAQAARINPSVCGTLLMPGVTASSLASALSILQFAGAVPVTATDLQPGEPALKCYVRATCTPSVRLHIAAMPGRTVVGRGVRLRIGVTVKIDGITQAVPGAAVRIGRHRRVIANSKGIATARASFGSTAASRRIVATHAEFLSAKTTLGLRARR